MKNKFKILIVTALLLGSCDENKSDYKSNTTSTANQWYSGGTLHQASVSEWKIASEENKLATCADIVASVKKHNNQSYNGDLLSMRQDAIQMMACIDEAVKGNAAKDVNVKINEVAAMCAILSNANK